MLIRRIATVVGGVMLALLLPACSVAAGDRPGMRPAPAVNQALSAQEVTLRARLQARLPALDLEQVSAEHALAVIRDVTHINIVEGTDALKGDQTPITLHLKDVRVDQAIKAVLAEAIPEAVLRFEVEDNLLDIGVPSDFVRHTVVRVYEVMDLLGAPEPQLPRPAAPATSEQPTTSESGGGMFFNPAVTEDRRMAAREQELIDTIESTVEPDQWRDKGGQLATVRTYKGTLIINAPPFIQDGVQEELAALRVAVGRAARSAAAK